MDVFGSVAGLYDRVRPRYPADAFADVVALSALPEGGRVLEIGCGTGQATLPMAARGYAITAIDVSPDLAAVARRKLAHFPKVEVIVSSFEDWTMPSDAFDLVFAATAFHWVEPSIRYRRAAEALKPGGGLAFLNNRHVAGGDRAFFEEVQACYRTYMPGAGKDIRLPEPDSFVPDTTEADGSGFFLKATERKYGWQQTYTAEDYIELLHTYSDHLQLDDALRQGLFKCIEELINKRFAGRIRKQYLTELLVARKPIQAGRATGGSYVDPQS
jgi:SAM-dependent methyltransferase